MCVVSVIYDYGHTLPNTYWNDYFNFQKYQELLNKAREFDEATGQPDCESEEKTQWFEELLRDIEDKYSIDNDWEEWDNQIIEDSKNPDSPISKLKEKAQQEYLTKDE